MLGAYVFTNVPEIIWEWKVLSNHICFFPKEIEKKCDIYILDYTRELFLSFFNLFTDRKKKIAIKVGEGNLLSD